MLQSFKNTFFSMRDLLAAFEPYFIAALLLLGLSYWWMNPTPPKTVTLATEPAHSDLDDAPESPIVQMLLIDALEHRTEQIDVPLSYAEDLYALRNNIQLVRKKLR